MVLDDDLVAVDPLRLPLDVALQVVVGHLDAELDAVLHVHHAAVGVVLGVDLAVENLQRGNYKGMKIPILKTLCFFEKKFWGLRSRCIFYISL